MDNLLDAIDIAHRDIVIALAWLSRLAYALHLRIEYSTLTSEIGDTKVITHNSLRLNPLANHLHDQISSPVREPNKSQIFVSKGVVVRVLVPPKNCISVPIEFYC